MKNTRLIGAGCKRSNAFSLCVLIGRGLYYTSCSFEGTIIFICPGGFAEGETPVPIPNTEVKPFWADGTSLATVRKSRSLPGHFFIYKVGLKF